MSRRPLDAEERARLLEGLSGSDLSQSAAALHALRAGCGCRGGERPIACVDLRMIYAARLEHLRRYDAAHPRQLADSVEEFIGSLEEAESSQALCYGLQPPFEFEFIVFVLAENGKVLGCLKTLPKTAVSPERWREIWGDEGPEDLGKGLI